jgi:hypothetical protein
VVVDQANSSIVVEIARPHSGAKSVAAELTVRLKNKEKKSPPDNSAAVKR